MYLNHLIDLASYDAAATTAESNATVDATRRAAYGDIGDQLDEIYHDIDAWRTRIQGENSLILKAQWQAYLKKIENGLPLKNLIGLLGATATALGILVSLKG